MPPESDEYRQNNPNSPFRTVAFGTKVTHKDYNSTGHIIEQSHDTYRIQWDDNPNGPTTWHGLAVLNIHWGIEPKPQRGDVVAFPGKDDRYVITQIEENGDYEAVDECGDLVSLAPQSVVPVANMRERGLAVLALQDRRAKLTEELEAENDKIEAANVLIRTAQARKEEVLFSKGMLASLVDEMLHDS